LSVYNARSMNLSRPIRLLLALSSGVALAFSFPLFNVSILAWIAPAILMVAILNETPRFALLLGWLQGAAFYLISVPWIYTVMRQYGPLPRIQAGGVLILMVIASAAFHAAFAFAVAWMGRYGTGRACLAAPFLWVSLEFLLLHLPDVGFPWNLLGYAAAQNLAFMQLTTITGIFGLSFLVAAYNALIAWTAQRPARENKGMYVVCQATSLILGVVAVFGPRFVPRAPSDHVAHLVQINLPQSMNYPSNWMDAHSSDLDQVEQISDSAAQKIPGLVVWPEVPAPLSLQDGRFLLRARRIARTTGDGFLLGVVDWKRLPNGEIGATNSAALLDRSGALDLMYDKIHLVPFGEYVPWRKWLTFAGKLTADIGDFQRGTQARVGRLSGEPVSAFICYEAIFPNEVRRFALAGADLFINISNDGWFGGSAAPAQHLAMARVRAVENRRWLLRDTNNGITVSVDPYGRIVAQLPAEIRGELDAPYGFRTDLTPYTRWGDWVAWLCVMVALMLLLLSARDALRHRRS